MSELPHFTKWDGHLKWNARKNAGYHGLHPVWSQTQFHQALLTEMELGILGITDCVKPADIPGVNTVQNLQPIDLKNELGLIEIIGPPGGGKDTMINLIKQLNLPKIYCTREEGYHWSQKDSPFPDIRRRHFQAYGGTDMEIDDSVDLMSFHKDFPTGAILLNRSIQDNFLAFGYSFFLAGYFGIKDLLMSQRFFHYFQYSPTIRVGNQHTSIENLTSATFILMLEQEQSLERKNSPGKGRILNLDFLSLLYSQYLRMISRLTTMRQRNLVILDMSGRIDRSVSLFNNAFNEVVKP